MEQNEKVTLQKLKREMEQMRAEYEARLQALSEERSTCEASLGDEGDRQKRAQQARAEREKQEKWLNEYVEIKLFKDNDKYKDDVYVAINGKNCVISRGVWTRIRRKFALLLDQSEIQDLRTAELMSGEAQRFAEQSRQRGI